MLHGYISLVHKHSRIGSAIKFSVDRRCIALLSVRWWLPRMRQVDNIISVYILSGIYVLLDVNTPLDLSQSQRVASG